VVTTNITSLVTQSSVHCKLRFPVAPASLAVFISTSESSWTKHSYIQSMET